MRQEDIESWRKKVKAKDMYGSYYKAKDMYGSYYSRDNRRELERDHKAGRRTYPYGGGRHWILPTV
jgi:hypothetical protein